MLSLNTKIHNTKVSFKKFDIKKKIKKILTNFTVISISV